MKKYFILILLLWISSSLFAQANLTAGGQIMTGDGEALVGVSVSVKENPSNGTFSTADGRFRLTGIAPGQTLTLGFFGYKPLEIVVAETNETMRLTMEEDINTMDEVIVSGRNTQRRISVTASVTTVDAKDLKVPATSISNMLGGRVPGIISITRSGEPGQDVSEFWIRGISTFGGGGNPLVLVDGVSGTSLNDLDPEDIESFSILKDAASTAMYGNQGANGVILVTTKKGVAGKLSVNFKANVGMSYSPRQPKYVNAIDYATLANEAAMTRGREPIYSAVDLALFENRSDPDLHPDVNWRDVILKDVSWNQQYYLSVSGGADVARYFLSFGVMNKDALFKQDRAVDNKYNTNVDYNKFNFRANVDVNLTRTTILTLGMENILVTQNYPGSGDSSGALWDAQANLTPVRVPIIYTTGQMPAYSTNNYEMSPWVLLNQTGYNKTYRNTNNMNLQLRQDLGMVTQGLSASMLFNMVGNTNRQSARIKTPELWIATGRKRDGSLDMRKIRDYGEPAYSNRSDMDRKFYLEGRVMYDRQFADRHRVSGLVHAYIEDSENSRDTNDLSAIPKRYNSYSGRFTYSLDDTYFIEANIGYTGSEAFEAGKKFGLFPAISAGWVPTQYDFMKDNLPFLNFLKFRFSYGIVGNDRIGGVTRFPYLTLMQSGTGTNRWRAPGGTITELQVGSSNLRWEKSNKTNFGIDFQAFDNRLEGTVDFFKDIRSGIYQQRQSIPDEMGLVNLPFANVGEMKSWGTDGHLSWTQTINQDAYFVVRGNFTQSMNEILEYEEAIVRYPYQSAVGRQSGINRGLIALGLFQDEEDIANSPRQEWMGSYMPGDIKYKDVNGDGIITDYDEVPLEYSSTPQIQYGFAGEFSYKNWNLSILFEGVSRVKYFSGGNGFFPFNGQEVGNVLTMVADQKNRWTSREISGDASTENPNARFPRLTYGGNDNNNRNSTHWLNNGRYMRIKNVQLSYTTYPNFLKRVGIQQVQFSLIGDNLHVWDKVKWIDPAQASSNGAAYPLQRVFTLQVNVKF